MPSLRSGVSSVLEVTRHAMRRWPHTALSKVIRTSEVAFMTLRAAPLLALLTAPLAAEAQATDWERYVAAGTKAYQERPVEQFRFRGAVLFHLPCEG